MAETLRSAPKQMPFLTWPHLETRKHFDALWTSFLGLPSAPWSQLLCITALWSLQSRSSSWGWEVGLAL